MVQNARDVSRKTGANIEFLLNDYEFVFQHNGLPFTATSLNALNIQSTSKVRDDIVQVGQYGTGFLTTHKFGLKFERASPEAYALPHHLLMNLHKDPRCALFSQLNQNQESLTTESAISAIFSSWVISKVERERISSEITSIIEEDVFGSNDAVASSRMRIGASLRNARANAICCFCPPESRDPLSPTTVL